MSEETTPIHPYIELLKGRDPIAVLADTPGELAKLFDGLTPEQIEHKPSPTKWSRREIMAHLVDCEIAWSWRLRRVFEGDNPALQPFDQDAWAQSYSSCSMEQARSTWAALRAWNLAFLSGLSEVQKQRPATHPEIGRMTLWTIAGIAAGHDLHHLRSLEPVIKG